MRSLCLFFSIFAIFYNTNNAKSVTRGNDSVDTLILVHTIFRHGNRTPDDGVYPNNPYGDESFYQPYGFGQLTDIGKRTEYKLGQALRERYNSFLGTEFKTNMIDARTTNVDRTKMSLLLVLASLFPPSGDMIWNRTLNWQPIPFNYDDNDKELLAKTVCKNYDVKYKKLKKSNKIKELLLVYKDVFQSISKHTGLEVTTLNDVAGIYGDLKAQEAYGYPVEDWTNEYFPVMEKITNDNYFLMTNKTSLKKIIGGFLLRKIINDSEDKIDVTSKPSPIKMYLYSVHEKNIATFLLTLGIFDNKVPAYGSYVLIELHQTNGIYGFKIFHQNYLEKDPMLLTIPGCSEFCPINDFKDILKKYIPNDDDCDM